MIPLPLALFVIFVALRHTKPGHPNDYGLFLSAFMTAHFAPSCSYNPSINVTTNLRSRSSTLPAFKLGGFGLPIPM